MSWSASAVGKAGKVAAAIDSQMATVKCSEPEQTVVMAARALLATALAGQIPDSQAVKVCAFGSQSVSVRRKDGPDQVQNSLTITVEPLYNFQE